jgi:hypothetical protein
VAVAAMENDSGTTGATASCGLAILAARATARDGRGETTRCELAHGTTGWPFLHACMPARHDARRRVALPGPLPGRNGAPGRDAWCGERGGGSTVHAVHRGGVEASVRRRDMEQWAVVL